MNILESHKKKKSVINFFLANSDIHNDVRGMAFFFFSAWAFNFKYPQLHVFYFRYL